VLRSVDPPVDRIHGQIVRDVRRIGKRIVLAAFDFEHGTLLFTEAPSGRPCKFTSMNVDLWM
jgi:hypothetical protein